MVDEIKLDARSLDDFASFARTLAAAARLETLGPLASNRMAENKGAAGVFDPVTRADRACEHALRHLIEVRFPDHGIIGEEYSEKPPKSGLTWSIDPIDGTRSYICGLPSWTTLIALLANGKPILGLIDVPCLDETYVGMGDRATLVCNGKTSALSTSGCDRIEQARFSTTDPFLLGTSAGFLQPLLNAVQVTRFGHDAYAYARLAAGTLDLVIEAGLKPHDYHALIPVVRAAGGYIGDWTGGQDFRSGNIIAAASRALYDATVEFIADA